MVIGSIQASDEYVVINCQWIMYIFGKASEGGGQVVSVQSIEIVVTPRERML